MDVTAIAQTVSQWLLPALPWLIEGSKTLGKAALEKGGEEMAVTLWDKVRGNERVLQAAQDVVADTGDEDAKQSFEIQLRRALKKNPDLAREIAALLQDKTPPGGRSVSVGGDVSNSTIITGDGNVVGSHNVVQRGKYNINAESLSGVAIGDQAKVERP